MLASVSTSKRPGAAPVCSTAEGRVLGPAAAYLNAAGAVLRARPLVPATSGDVHCCSFKVLKELYYGGKQRSAAAAVLWQRRRTVCIRRVRCWRLWIQLLGLHNTCLFASPLLLSILCASTAGCPGLSGIQSAWRLCSRADGGLAFYMQVLVCVVSVLSVLLLAASASAWPLLVAAGQCVYYQCGLCHACVCVGTQDACPAVFRSPCSAAKWV